MVDTGWGSTIIRSKKNVHPGSVPVTITFRDGQNNVTKSATWNHHSDVFIDLGVINNYPTELNKEVVSTILENGASHGTRTEQHNCNGCSGY